MLGFICSKSDRAELRTWLLNNNCFTQGPDFLDKHVIFIDKETLINGLKAYKEKTFDPNSEKDEPHSINNQRIDMDPPSKNSTIPEF